MTASKRLLKQHLLVSLLERSIQFLGPGYGIFVLQGETILGSAGDVQCDITGLPEQTLFQSLRHDGVEVAQLLLIPPVPTCADDSCTRLHLPKFIEFLAYSIEELLRGEAVRRSLASETLQKYREIALLHRASVNLNNSLRPRDVARALLNECQQGAMPAEGGMLFLRDGTSAELIPYDYYGSAYELELEKVVDTILFLDIIRGGKGEIINDLTHDSRWHNEIEAVKAMLLVPLVSSNKCVGALVLATSQTPRFDASHLQYISTIVSVVGIALGNALNFESVQVLMKALLQALATAIDARDPFTSGHSQRVARLAVALSKVVHDDNTLFPDVVFSEDNLHEVFYAGLLHDVGKIGIREQVLTKSSRLPARVMDVIQTRMAMWGEITGKEWRKYFEHLSRINSCDMVSRDDAAIIGKLGKFELRINGTILPLLSDDEITSLLIPRGNLTVDERREIERHPVESFRILQHIPFPENMRSLLRIISQHHERLDGSGYPSGDKGDDILLQTRIISIVDIYDAITMERHYKPALPRDKALDVLTKEADAGRIDARLVELLKNSINAIEEDAQRMATHEDFQEYLQRSQNREHSDDEAARPVSSLPSN
ncbi:HD domain-containing phosphohydrolase [Desulfovibrio inopinatus]|uniref:HD domain-containing phosphohydrolase n=1 Tax=Desulfovibrio inopinatus TaxID=102109 RepID=UPI00041A108D|nr:HD domain-containing phosphohydrolase [Desulfovibrio inopinatus]